MEQSRRRNDDYMCGKLALRYSVERAFCPEDRWTVMAERRLRYISMRNLTQQSYCYVLLFPFISLVFTEPLRTGAKNIVSETKIIRPRAPGGGPVAEVAGDQAQQVPSEGVSSLTDGPLWSQRAWQHDEKLTIFQKIFNLQKLVPTQDLQENVSEAQHSITIPNVHVKGYGTTSSWREDTYPWNDERLYLKVFFRGNFKIGLVRGKLVTKRYDRHGIEIIIDSQVDDGTQSWVVISREVEWFVTELALDHRDPIHHEEGPIEHGVTRRIKLDRSTVETEFIFVVIKECDSVNQSTPQISWLGWRQRCCPSLIATTPMPKIRERKYGFASLKAKQQTKVPVLLGYWWKISCRACHWRPFWREQSRSVTAGQWANSLWVKIYWCFASLKFHYNSRYTTVFVTAVESADRTPRRTHIFNQFCRVGHARAHLIMQTCEWLKREFRLTCDVQSCVFWPMAHPKHLFIHHVSFHTSRRSWNLLFVLFLTVTDHTHCTTADWNQEYFVCCFAGRKTVWLRAPRHLWSLRSFYWTRLVCVPDDCCKNHRCHCKITSLRWTSSWCSICQLSDKIGGGSQIDQNSKFGMSRHLVRLPRHKWPKSMSSMADPVVPLERNLYGPPWAGLLWRRQYKEALDGRKFQIGNVCSFIVNKGYFCRYTWMTSKWRERSGIWLLCGRNWWNT